MGHHTQKCRWLLKRVFADWLHYSPKTIVLPKKDWETSFKRFEKLFPHRLIFTDTLASVSSYSYDYAIPTAPVTFEDFQAHEQKPSRLIAPTREVHAILSDKLLFHEFYARTELASYLPRKGTAIFPAIEKPRVGANSENCRIIFSEKDLKNENFKPTDSFLYEEYIPGSNEYACHILARKGKILDLLCIEYSFDSKTPIKAIDSAKKQIVKEKHQPLLEKFLMKLSYTGFCCINYKLRGNTPVIFEINPRIGGSFCEYFLGFVAKLEELRT